MTAGNDAMVVSAIGLQSSLGGAIHAAAAFRCGMSRGRELPEWPYFDREEHDAHLLRGHPAMGVAPGFQGMARFLKLGSLGLADLGSSMDLAGIDPSRTAVSLVLPRVAMGLERVPGEMAERLCRIARLDVAAAARRTSFEGRVGLVGAITEARRLLQGHAIDHCLVGTIDTLVDAARIRALLVRGMIKTADYPVGLVPGEAACFLLLERRDRARLRGAPIGALIHPPSAIAAPDPEDPGAATGPPGRALSEVILEAARSLGASDERGTLYVDLDGTTRRAADFGNALLHLGRAGSLDQWRRAFPAESFGDTGASSGALAIGLSARAFLRGYAVGNRALVVMSSETGGRAALGLSRAD